MNNYFYTTYTPALNEISSILNELQKCFNQNLHFSTIILTGAINERLVSEKLIGHSKVLEGNGWKAGTDFHISNQNILTTGSKSERKEFLRKFEVEIYRGLLDVDEIFSLFDVKIQFEAKIQLLKKINVGEEHIKKIKLIHDLRIKYFHPFKTTNSDSIEQDAKTAYDTIKALVESFYDIR